MTGAMALPPCLLEGRPPDEILVIVPRRIGDVLLATPLIRSLKHAWPRTAVDALVFDGTQGILAGNPDLRRVLTISDRPSLARHFALLIGLYRRYELALSLVPGDRPTLYAFFAGRWRAGLLLDTRKERWKRRFLHHWEPFDDLNTHTVRMHLALARALAVPPRYEVAAHWCDEDALQVDRALGGSPSRSLAVLHPYPKFNYKMWHREGWLEVARWLVDRGYGVVMTGSDEAAELAYVSGLMRDMPAGTVNVAGRLSLGAVVCLMSRARIYIGPDTAVTHIAAARGVPTVALFGPTNAVKWGPWPRTHSGDTNPWRRCGSQRNGNVALVQGAIACVPCMLEGCERHSASFSDCLLELPARKVISALRDLLDRAA